MSTYQMESQGVPVCGAQAGAYYIVQITTQNIAEAYWSGGLTAPDWSNPVSLAWPFTAPEAEFGGAPDAGQHGAAVITLEGDNRDLGGGVRLHDLVSGYDPNNTEIHIRIGRKTVSTDPYVYRFWGTYNTDSLEVTYGDFSDPDSWTIRFTATDSIQQLARRKVDKFTEDILIHKNYDYKTAAVHVNFIGTIDANPDRVPKGTYSILNALYFEGGKWIWFNNLELVGHAYDVMRWMKLTEIFQAFSDYLGLGTTVNDGTGWGYVHTWAFGFNTAAPDATEAMTWVGIDKLYILSGLWYGLDTVYKHGGSFFDDGKEAGVLSSPSSFYQRGSALEMLKYLCTSLGLVCRVRVNGAGDRYLEIVEASYFTHTLSSDIESIQCDAVQRPYDRAITGIQVNAPMGDDTDEKRGDTAQKSVSIDCAFSSCNNVRENTIFWNIQHANPALATDLQLGNDVWYSLWASSDTPTGTRGAALGDALDVATMHSVSAIVPASLGTFPGATAYIEGSHGAYQTAAPFALNAVMYPNTAGVYCAWIQVPEMALAHYFWSPYDTSKDIGIFRPIGRTLKLTYQGITDAIMYPGSRIAVEINGFVKTWIVQRVREKYAEECMEIEAEIYTI